MRSTSAPNAEAGLELAHGGVYSWRLRLKELSGNAVSSPPGDVTRLLLAWSNGDRDALEGLIPVVYGELRRIAARDLEGEANL